MFTFRTPTGADPATVDAFATVVFEGIAGLAPKPGNLDQITDGTAGTLSANWKNTGANSITTQVLGTNDKDAPDADCDIVVASAALAAGIVRHVLVNPATYAFYRFQHKATAGRAPGSAQRARCRQEITR